MNAKLVGLVTVSTTVTIAVINKSTNQIATINYLEDTSQLASKIYSHFVGLSIEEIYMAFDTKTVSAYNEQVIALNKFNIGTTVKHSVISLKDLEAIQSIGRTLSVKSIKIFDYIALFKAISNDREAIIMENCRDGIRAIHVERGEIKGYRLGVTANSIKSTVKVTNAEIKKLFNIDFARKYGSGLINFDMLDNNYKLSLVPVLFMLYNPECLEINPYGQLPQPKPAIYTRPVEPVRYTQPVEQPVPKEHQQVPPYQPVPPQRKVSINKNPFEGKVKEENTILSMIGNGVGVIAGLLIGVSIACTTQLPKQNIILMDTLQTVASTSNAMADTTQYYDRLIAGITDVAKTNSAIISKISAITEGGTIAEINMKKNDVEVLVLADNEENLNKFKTALEKVIKVGEVTNAGEVTLGETALTKYKIFCYIE